MALMPAYFLTGIAFVDAGPEGTTTAFQIAELVAFIFDAIYYGLVLLIVWRGLWLLLRRIGSSAKSA